MPVRVLAAASVRMPIHGMEGAGQDGFDQPESPPVQEGFVHPQDHHIPAQDFTLGIIDVPKEVPIMVAPSIHNAVVHEPMAREIEETVAHEEDVRHYRSWDRFPAEIGIWI